MRLDLDSLTLSSARSHRLRTRVALVSTRVTDIKYHLSDHEVNTAWKIRTEYPHPTTLPVQHGFACLQAPRTTPRAVARYGVDVIASKLAARLDMNETATRISSVPLRFRG